MNNPFIRTALLLAMISYFGSVFLYASDDWTVESLIKSGKFSEARSLIEQRIQLNSQDPVLLYNLALTYYADGNYEEAVVLWEKVRLSDDKDLVTKAMAQIGNSSYRISVKIGEEGRKEDETIQLRRALHSLQAAVERDDGYSIAQQNLNFVAERLVEHLVEQGKSKTKRTEEHWIRGERDLVLLRSALTDFEEALAIRPEDDEIQKLVQETRSKMTDHLTESGNQNLLSAEKKIEEVKQTAKEGQLGRDDGRELQRAQDEITEAVANFEDAASISPTDKTTRNDAEKARAKASLLMEDIASMWQKNSEGYEQRAMEKQSQRNEIAKKLENENNKKRQDQLRRESHELAKEINRDQQAALQQAEKALEDYELAIDYDPANQSALAAMQELKQKMSKQSEAEADKSLEVADSSQAYINRNIEQMTDYQKQLDKADDKKAQQIQSRMDDVNQQNAALAQRAADELIDARAQLQHATELDPENLSAASKLEQTNERIAGALEQAGDLQMMAAEQLQQKGQEDQAIARMEQAIKDYDSAMALTQQEGQEQALGEKLNIAREELLAHRNERAQQLNAQMQQQLQQQASQTPPQQVTEQSSETAYEYMEMVQFAEDSKGSEEFGNFDTKAMKSVVKDW